MPPPKPPPRGTWQPGSGKISEEARALVEARKEKEMFARVAAEAEAREESHGRGGRAARKLRRTPVLVAAAVVLAGVSVFLNFRPSPPVQHPADIKHSYQDILPLRSLDALSGQGWIVHPAEGWAGLQDRAVAQAACAELVRRLTPERGQRLMIVDGAGEPLLDCTQPELDLQAQ